MLRKNYPYPIAESVFGLIRAVSSHEKRDRIIEVFRTAIRFLAAYAIGVRTQFGTGPDGETKTLSNLIASLRRRGLTDGQWVAILRELLREYKSVPDQISDTGDGFFVSQKKSKFAKLTNELLDMRKSQTVAHGRVFEEERLQLIIEERLPQLEIFITMLRPIFDQIFLCVGSGKDENRGTFLLHGMGSADGVFSRYDCE